MYNHPIDAVGKNNRGSYYNVRMLRLFLKAIRSKKTHVAFDNNVAAMSRWLGATFCRVISFEGAYMRDIDSSAIKTAVFNIGSEINEFISFDYNAFEKGFSDAFDLRACFISGNVTVEVAQNWISLVGYPTDNPEDKSHLEDVAALLSGLTDRQHIEGIQYVGRSNVDAIRFPYGFTIDSE